MSRLKIVVAVLLALLLLVVIVQNTESVDTQLLFVTITMPRAALLFAATIVGFVVGLLTALHVVRRGEKKPSPKG